MLNWWNDLDFIQQIFAVFAVPATVILLIQTLLLLLGMGGADGGDMPDDADDAGLDLSESSDAGLRIFTVRGLVAFFAVGGWVGIALIDQGFGSTAASFLALLAGSLALVAVAWLFKTLLRLQSSGNLDIANAIGLTGRVYLRIPGTGQGTGKVTLLVQERSLEIDAFTDEEQEIKTGQAVKVIAKRGNQLLVRRIDQSNEM